MQRCPQFSNPKFNYHKKSQLVTITSAMLNERKQNLCDSLLNYNCSIKLSSYLKEVN